MERVFIGIFPGNKILEQIEKIRSESALFLQAVLLSLQIYI